MGIASLDPSGHHEAGVPLGLWLTDGVSPPRHYRVLCSLCCAWRIVSDILGPHPLNANGTAIPLASVLTTKNVSRCREMPSGAKLSLFEDGCLRKQASKDLAYLLFLLLPLVGETAPLKISS